MEKIVAIALGGALGALGRVYGSQWIGQRLLGSVPYGTLVVNLLGAFMIGLLLGLFASHPQWPAWLRYLLVAGGLGAFTTFSTYVFEMVDMIMQGSYGLALLYGFGQVLAGLLVCALGLFLARIGA